MYANGRGVAKDDQKAVECYQLAAKLGDADAQFELGRMYLTGRGVAKDEEKAVDWLQQAAEQGHEHAKRALDGFAISSQKPPQVRFKAH